MLRIELDSFDLHAGRRSIFRHVSASLNWSGNDGGIIGLMGPSGAGKTSLARVVLDHRYLSPMRGLKIFPSGVAIAIVPQTPVLFQHLSLEKNARLFQFVGRYRERFDDQEFRRLSRLLGLDDITKRTRGIAELSGGEAQRLMLLRTLAVKPDLLILDEPCSGLDPSVRESFLSDLVSLVDGSSVKALYIGHHWEEIAPTASQVAYLSAATDVQVPDFGQLAVYGMANFAAAPPTPEAFQTVHGSGASVWPLIPNGNTYEFASLQCSQCSAGGLIVCVPASSSRPALREYLKSGPFRLEMALTRSETPVRGWIYLGGHLLKPNAIINGASHVNP